MKYVITVLLLLVYGAFTQAQTVIINNVTGNNTTLNLTNTQPQTATTKDSSNSWISHRLGSDTIPLSHTVFSLSTDMAQYFLFQPNINFEYRVSSRSAIGINFGIVEPTLVFAANPLATSQFTDPGTVYKGIALRLYLKFHTGKSRKNYWSIEGVYKQLSYNNVTFSDQYGTNVLNIYTMNEKTAVYGIELLHGHELSRINERFHADFFYGAGFHQRYRNYTVTSGNIILAPGAGDSGINLALPGTYSSVLSIITPVVGVKLGWNYLKRN